MNADFTAPVPPTATTAVAGSRTAIVAGLFAAVITFLVFTTYFSIRFGLNSPPSATGDEPDYDSIAWEISRGRGFAVDYLDSDFRRPYDERATTDPLYRTDSRRQGTSCYRPPLFPAVVSLGDALFGRQFWFMRLCNIAAMSSCCGLTVAAVVRCLGLPAGWMSFVLFAAIDVRTRLYARAMLTEAFAAFETAALVALLVWFLNGRWQRTAMAGLVTAAMILTRPMFVMWLPWLVIVVAWLAALSTTTARLRTAISQAILYSLVVIAAIAPWSIRCSLVTGRFMPLGTQGAIELPAAWGDLAWRMNGEWRAARDIDFFEPEAGPGLTLIQRELQAADDGVARARHWIAANPGRAFALIPIKIFNEFRPKDWSQALLLTLAVIGAVTGSSVATDNSFARLRAIGLSLILAQMLAVGLTWTVPESRFVVPLLIIEHVFAAAGAWWITSRFVSSPHRTKVPKMR